MAETMSYMCFLAVPQHLLQAGKREISSLTVSNRLCGGASEDCLVMVGEFNARVGSRTRGNKE